MTDRTASTAGTPANDGTPAAGGAPVAEGTAVVTMELERGVVGDVATIAELRDAAAQRGTLEACGSLARLARSAGIPVVHCIAQWRPDRTGTPLNTPLTRALARNPGQVAAGTGAVELVAELGDTGGDLRSVRHHGMGPWHGTDLDPLLRSMGIGRVVVAGVSLNVGIPALVIGAVDRGYEVTVVTDAVVGVPTAYGDEVLAHSLGTLAGLTTTGELAGAWA